MRDNEEKIGEGLEALKMRNVYGGERGKAMVGKGKGEGM